jgi:hypothetical protein
MVDTFHINYVTNHFVLIIDVFIIINFGVENVRSEYSHALTTLILLEFLKL